MRRRRSALALAVAIALAVIGAIVVALTVGSAPPRGGDAAASAPPAPTGAQNYRSPLGYTVQLPAGWRRSEVVSRSSPDPRGDPELFATDVFTIRSPQDEQSAIARTHVGFGAAHAYTAFVRIDRNSRGLDALAFAAREKNSLGLFAVSVEETTFHGRPAAKTTWRSSPADPATFFALYVPDESRRIWVIGYYLAPQPADVPAGATEPDVRGIVESFRYDPAAAAPTATTAPVPNEAFGFITMVATPPGQFPTSLRGERDPRPFASLGTIGLTWDSRPAGAVSPDGKRFAYWQPEVGITAAAPGQSSQLRLWDAASPTTTTLLLRAPLGENGDAVVWSTDGQGLLVSFSSSDHPRPGTPVRPEYGAIRTLELAGGRSEELARDSGGALSPLAWDRSRGVVAFVGLLGNQATAYSVVRRGGTAITHKLENARHLSASPDATWVVAVADLPNTGRLRAWPLEEPTQVVELTPQRVAEFTMSHVGWRPGTREVGASEHARVHVGFGAGYSSLWNPATRRRTDVSDARDALRLFRADGAVVYVATSDVPARYVAIELASGRREDLPVANEREILIGAVRLR